MKKIILLTMMLMLFAGLSYASIEDFNEWQRESIRETGTFLEKARDALGLVSVQGDLFCCEACQPSQTVDTNQRASSGLYFGRVEQGQTKTITCGTDSRGAVIDTYLLGSQGDKQPFSEEWSPFDFTCPGSAVFGCEYECYICNIEDVGGSVGLDICSTDQDCKDAASDLGLDNVDNYICTSAGTCRQNCDASWGAWECFDSDTKIRHGTRADTCADRFPQQKIDCNTGDVCVEGECVGDSDLSTAPSGDTTDGGNQEDPTSTSGIIIELPTNPSATEPNITLYKGTTFTVLENKKIELNFYLKNTGSDMPRSWILEVQPDAQPTGIQALVGFGVGPQETCDALSPENVHKDFRLQAGQKEIVTITIDIPDEDITTDGNSFLFPIIRKDCANALPNSICQNAFTLCTAGNGCFQQPFCDGKADVEYTNTVDSTDKHISLIPVDFSAQEAGFCVPAIDFETVDSGFVSEAELKDSLANRRSECCAVEDNNRELVFMGEDQFEELFDLDLPLGTTRILSNPSICIDVSKTEEALQDRPGDICGWTGWAPTGFFGQCGNAFAIVGVGLLIFFMVFSAITSPRGRK